MPQQNAFHNLLFLLEKRRKRGEGHKQNKQERSERRREESARAEKGGTGDTSELVLVKLVRSSLLTGGWGGLWRYTEAENGLLM